MKLFHLLGFTKELVFGSSAFVIILNLFFVCFVDGSRFFKELAERFVTLLKHLVEGAFY